VHEARDDVFAGAALAMNQDGNIGASNLIKAAAESLHGLGLSEDDRFRWNFAD
jgi:hypothetical protein